MDDEPKFQKALTINFRHEITEGSLEFEFAQNGREALEIAQKSPEINLIITDINMPEMDGLTFLEKLKKLKPTITAIVITGYNDTDNVSRALKTGARDCISKSTDFNELKRTINSALATRTIDVSAIRVDDTEAQDREHRNAKQKYYRKERTQVRVSTITSWSRSLRPEHRYEAVVEIIAKHFTAEQIEDLEYELETLKLLAIENEKIAQRIEYENSQTGSNKYPPLSTMSNAYLDYRVVTKKLKDKTTRTYGPYWYLRYYNGEDKKTEGIYFGQEDPRLHYPTLPVKVGQGLTLPPLPKVPEPTPTREAVPLIEQPEPIKNKKKQLLTQNESAESQTASNPPADKQVRKPLDLSKIKIL